MAIDTGAVLLSMAGVFLLYLVCRVFLKPIKWLAKLVLSTALGGLGIAVGNLALGYFGIHLALNPLNAMILGVLGIPGMAMIEILSRIL